MNSNLKIRDTFGIVDPLTSKPYEDIIRSFLILSKLSISEYKTGFINEPSLKDPKSFKLFADSELRKELRTNKESSIKVLISFQIRTDGNYAMARLFKEEE